MPYRQFPYKGFGGGLNLRDAPDVVDEDQAINALNVLYTTRGAVAQRSGYARFTAAEHENVPDSLAAFYKSDGTVQLLVGNGPRVDVVNTAGSLLGSDTAQANSPHFFQRFGGPTAEHIYYSNGTDAVARWTGTGFEQPLYLGVTPTGRFLALSSTDNRLINARFSGTTAGNNPSTVRFSAEGDPTSWGPTNYVDLTPGDGEEITGVVSWRDLVIVFKQTKFFTFYGQSVDDDGEPVFNYRPVDAGVGLVSPRAFAISEQGIYFLDRSGIYFTTGSQPARVSDLVRPIFHGDPSVYYTGGALNTGSIEQSTMVYHDERLWFSFPGGQSAVNDRQLVFDPHEKWWSLTNLPAGPMTNFRIGSSAELVFGYSSGTKHLGRYKDGAYTADDMDQSGAGGTAIVARWQGGWFNYDSPMVKTIREAKITGTGMVNVSFYRDYRLNPTATIPKELSPPVRHWNDGTKWDTPGLVWGPNTIVRTRLIRRAVQGEAFSIGFANSELNRSFKVQRLTTHLREARIPTVVKAT